MRKCLLLCWLWLSVSVVLAQEFNVRVNIQTPNSQGVDRNNINRLRQDIANYLNTRRWTGETVAPHERINVIVTIVLSANPGQDRYEGTMQVQASRPVYGSTYETLLLNFQDRDFRVTYQQFQPLQYSENTFVSSLVSILNFYAWTVLGMDADTFAPQGGTEFHQKAQAEVLLAQNSGEIGWRPADGLNTRYWVNENLLNGSYAGIRDVLYQYHRSGLDQMADRPAQGREAVLTGMEQLQDVFQRNPNAFLVRVVMDTKMGELPRLFATGTPEQKRRLLNVVQVLDPSNLSMYQAILN